ncbi:MAG: homoserine kinase [Bacteroidota bacterium]|jgi:homoserine kinase|nr:homoserine kinase [Bacteroidota bacterium]
MKEVKVSCPATVANLVCGFDVLGLCIKEPFDIISMKLLDENKIIIISSDNFPLPVDPEKNTAGAPLLQMKKELNQNIGFEITITKNIKPGSGIGSSAASASGSIVAANYLLGNIFSQKKLVEFAMYGEQLASGAMHADNVAPGIFGGITLLRSTEPLDVISISAPKLYVSLLLPKIEIKTSDARNILPKNIPLKDAIKQWANIAGLVAGLLKEDYDLISRSLEDVLIEPVRSKLIPSYDKIKRRSMEIGALGGGISGSGPAVFMLSKDETTASKVAQEMKEIYEQVGVEYETYVTTINHKGVEII